jgi:hypothetical protein
VKLLLLALGMAFVMMGCFSSSNAPYRGVDPRCSEFYQKNIMGLSEDAGTSEQQGTSSPGAPGSSSSRAFNPELDC